MKTKFLSLAMATIFTMSSLLQTYAIAESSLQNSTDYILECADNTYNILKSLGFNDQLLNKLLKSDALVSNFSTYQNQPIYINNDFNELVKANSIDLFDENTIENETLNVPLDGSTYDGNPPYNSEQQITRINYLQNVMCSEYSAPKYYNTPYLAYLYISHYTENINYDRTQSDASNFNSVYANIISSDDIVAFNKFLNNSEMTYFANTLVKVNNVISFANTSADNLAFIKGELYDIDNLMSLEYDNFQNLITLNPPDFWEGLSEDELLLQQYTLLEELATIFTYNINNYEKDEEKIIEDMLLQMETSGDIENIVVNYVNLMCTLIASSTFGTILAPVMSCVFLSVGLLSPVISTSSLASLYYTYNIRKTQRFRIYAGLTSRP